MREKFCESFNVTDDRKVRLYRKSFTRVYDSFLKHGSVKDNASKANNKRPSKITPETVSVVRELYTTNPETSIRKASRDLNLSFSVVRKILKQKL